ncbi:MAG TPA: glycosyl hydrolase [Blastocatellia bacterium]|nr:glycosyl hydrolase [Blastocatellia bacterium]
MRPKVNRILAIKMIAIIFLAGSADAQSSSSASTRFDPSLFNALRWRNIGPDRGGRSIACAGSPSRLFEYYFGATGGGLWKTTDGGTTWKPVTDGQIKSSSIGAVAVSESNPDIVFIGMGETELRGNIMQGDGVYKSTDAGKTWAHSGLSDTHAISRIRIHPKNPDLIYVCALGHPYGPNDERGIFRSKDGGKTWQKVLFRSNHSGAVDLCFDPQDPKVMFASIWDAYRTSWSLSSGGPESGLFKTTDSGDTWKEITRNAGLPKGVIGKIGVSVSGADGKRVYAIVEAEDGGVFASDDSGATWKKVSEDRRLRQRAFYYSRLYADPKALDTLYVLNTGFYKSTDGGKTYKTIRVPHGDNHDLWIATNDPQRMINSNDGGANVSINGGETWTDQEFPTAQLYHVATTKDFPYHVCGAQQDNSTVCVSSESGGRGGRTPNVMYAVGGGESGYIAPHPGNPSLFYAGSQGALLTRFDRSTGHTRDIQVYPLFFSGMPASALKERWQWTFPIVFSPHDPNVLYTSSQHLWRTTNDGQSWERISPDLTRADPKTLGDSGGPITKDQNGPEIFATIFTIALSRLEPNTIWTGSDDGLAYITRDGGKKWENISPKGLPEFSRISLIDASPHKPGTAYLAAKRYQLDDRRPYLYKTHDYGKNWSKIVSGIRADDYVHAVREDPKRPGLLYAGTEHGIYVSFDDGDNWQSLSLNLPDTQVPDLVVEENDLVIATHGRSFYVLDDIGLLRQLVPEFASGDIHLFQPRTAIRSASQAAIDYNLKKQADKITIEILDSKDRIIRTFVGSPEEDKRRSSGSSSSEEGESFGPPATRPPGRKAGTNRFLWDLRYPGATVFEGMILWSARAESGPLAPPGDYRVRLTVDGQTQTQTFAIKRDPRLTNVTDADLVEQFDLAMKVRDKTSEANGMVILIRDIKKQITERSEKSKDHEVSEVGQALTQKLSAIEEEVYQVRNRSNQDPLNFPIKLNNQIAALRRSIETGDGRPTSQSYVVFKELSTQVDVLKARLNGLLVGELMQFNKVLAKRNLEPIQAAQSAARSDGATNNR